MAPENANGSHHIITYRNNEDFVPDHHVCGVGVYGRVLDGGLKEFGQVEEDGQGKDGHHVLEDAAPAGLGAVHALVVVCSHEVCFIISVKY